MTITDETSATLPLADAVERFKAEPGAPANAYSWYRKQAMRGQLTFGRGRQLVQPTSTKVTVKKLSNRWVVDSVQFEAALVEHRAAVAEAAEITAAYKDHRLLGQPGQTVYTTWGGYRSRGTFHASWSAGPTRYGGGFESWKCTTCWEPAVLEHDRPECHVCSDWNGCGRDCTLSGVRCPTCGTSMTV